MKIQPKKEIERMVTHKGASNLQKIEMEKRHTRREEIREKPIALQRRMVSRVTKHEENMPHLGHD